MSVSHNQGVSSLQELHESLQPYPSDGPRMTAINKLLVSFIVQDLQPLSVVENRGFRALIRGLDRRVVLPCRSTIANSLLPKFYEEVKSDLKKKLASVKHCCLTTDI